MSSSQYAREEDSYATKAETPRIAPHGAQEYKGNRKHSWEHVIGNTWRLRVPSGWLYTGVDGVGASFVPMPEVVGYKI